MLLYTLSRVKIGLGLGWRAAKRCKHHTLSRGCHGKRQHTSQANTQPQGVTHRTTPARHAKHVSNTGRALVKYKTGKPQAGKQLRHPDHSRGCKASATNASAFQATVSTIQALEACRIGPAAR